MKKKTQEHRRCHKLRLKKKTSADSSQRECQWYAEGFMIMTCDSPLWFYFGSPYKIRVILGNSQFSCFISLCLALLFFKRVEIISHLIST